MNFLVPCTIFSTRPPISFSSVASLLATSLSGEENHTFRWMIKKYLVCHTKKNSTLLIFWKREQKHPMEIKVFIANHLREKKKNHKHIPTNHLQVTNQRKKKNVEWKLNKITSNQGVEKVLQEDENSNPYKKRYNQAVQILHYGAEELKLWVTYKSHCKYKSARYGVCSLSDKPTPKQEALHIVSVATIKSSTAGGGNYHDKTQILPSSQHYSFSLKFSHFFFITPRKLARNEYGKIFS